MRYMVIMIPGNEGYEQGAMPNPEDVHQMMKFNEELVNAGVMLAGDGLHPTSQGARFSMRDGKRTVIDGPFTEAREIIGGYWMWQVKSKEEAMAWAARCPLSEGDTVELRRCFDPEDFGPEIAAQEHELYERIGQKMSENAGQS